MELSNTALSSSVIPPFSSSSSNAVPAPKMAGPSNAKDLKLWLAPVEKQFIDVLLEEEAKGNMPSGQFKKSLWTVIQDEFNQRTGKRYRK
nr:hypothetical protein CFP56_42014 [Quercus suber]